MPGFRIACQTITWGETQIDRLDEILPAMREMGYEGVEMGYRRVSAIPPAEFRAKLAEHGLALTGLHAGGNLEDPAQAGAEQREIEAILDYLQAVGCDRLVYSGLRFEDKAQFEADLARLCRAASACGKRGMRLLYHNHDWELPNDWRVLRALDAAAGPALGMCPDVGWLHKGGADVLAVLDAFAERIDQVHFKDFATLQPGVDTVELGRGVVPLADVAAWLKQNKPAGLWVIAEQDRAEGNIKQALATNAEFLQGVMAE